MLDLIVLANTACSGQKKCAQSRDACNTGPDDTEIPVGLDQVTLIMSITVTTSSIDTLQGSSKILAQNDPKETAFDDDGEEETIEIIDNLWSIPTFEDKYAERQWAKEHMAGAFRVFAKLGYTDGAGGHISLRDPVRPDCFWISKESWRTIWDRYSANTRKDPYSVHFGLVKASDLILVNENGKPLMPTKFKVNKAGFMIHAALHKARPDVNAACHTHSPYGRAWSAFGKPIEMLNQGKDMTKPQSLQRSALTCINFPQTVATSTMTSQCMRDSVASYSAEKKVSILRKQLVHERRVLYCKIMGMLQLLRL